MIRRCYGPKSVYSRTAPISPSRAHARDVSKACCGECAWRTVLAARILFDDVHSYKGVSEAQRTRIPVETFRKALAVAGVAAESDEVECILANMIYKVRRARLSAYSRDSW